MPIPTRYTKAHLLGLQRWPVENTELPAADYLVADAVGQCLRERQDCLVRFAALYHNFPLPSYYHLWIPKGVRLLRKPLGRHLLVYSPDSVGH